MEPRNGFTVVSPLVPRTASVVWGIFFEATMKPEQHRRRMRRLASDANDLIAALNATYPLRPPKITDSDREVWFKAGQRDVVEFLLTLQEEARRAGNVLET